MAIRRDPLAAAAEAISAIEARCQGGKLNVRLKEAGEEEEQADGGSGVDPSLVCTVGSISVWPGASNVIPGSANFSVDIRSACMPHLRGRSRRGSCGGGGSLGSRCRWRLSICGLKPACEHPGKFLIDIGSDCKQHYGGCQ